MLTSFYPQVEAKSLPQLGEEAIFESLYELGIPEEGYVVIGGANLVLRGIRGTTEDIDILVSDELFTDLSNHPLAKIKKPPLEAQLNGATNESVWVKSEGLYLPVSATQSMGDGFYPISFDESKPRSEVVKHVPCASLEEIIKSKQHLRRVKDIGDLALISEFLGENIEIPVPLARNWNFSS